MHFFNVLEKNAAAGAMNFTKKPIAVAVFFENIVSFFIFVCLDHLTKGPMPLFCEPD
jgi:hypothetical protein